MVDSYNLWHYKREPPSMWTSSISVIGKAKANWDVKPQNEIPNDGLSQPKPNKCANKSTRTDFACDFAGFFSSSVKHLIELWFLGHWSTKNMLVKFNKRTVFAWIDQGRYWISLKNCCVKQLVAPFGTHNEQRGIHDEWRTFLPPIAAAGKQKRYADRAECAVVPNRLKECNPEIGIKFGTRHFSFLKTRGGSQNKWF